MSNHFYTRKKFGRFRFDVIIMLVFTIITALGYYLGITFGFAEETFTSEENILLSGIVAIIGNMFILLFTELISNLNNSLISDLVKANIIEQDSEVFEENARKFIWSNKVYILSALFYCLFFSITTIGILINAETWYGGVLGGYMGQFILAIIFAELLWSVLAPPIFILFISRYKLKLNIFSGDKSGGLGIIADYLLKISLMITFFGSLLLYWIIQPTTPIEISILALISIISAPIIYFIIPTLNLNSIMSTQKNAVIDKLDKNIQESYDKIVTLTYEDASKELLEYIETNIRLKDQAMQMHEWPFSVSGLRNLSSSFIIPIGIFLLNNSDKLINF